MTENETRGRGTKVLLAVLLTGLVIIGGRLSYLQLLHGDTYRALSRANALETERLTPLRGRILARDGTVLAGNRLATDLLYRGGEVARWSRLRYLLDLGASPLAPNPDDPEQAGDGAVLAWNIPDEALPAVAELIAGQKNLYLRERLERSYPTGLAAHAIGYTGANNPEGSVGELGLERAYQGALAGHPGRALLEVDTHSLALGRTVVQAAEPGRDIVLTLDVTAQRAAERALTGAKRYVNAERVQNDLPPVEAVRGALIAMNPQTGEILALASAPSFDPNLFAHRPVAQQRVADLLENTRTTPLVNRAVSAYPPASTFKVISSLALLDGGYITPTTRYDCAPSFAFGDTLLHNWSSEDKGRYAVSEALADSCNTFYWQAAARTPGATRGWNTFAAQLEATARTLGYGQPLGIGLPEEQPGRVPSRAWAEAFYGHPWYPGYTMNMVIGQGDLLVTPLQVLQLVGTVAMNGEQITPHLVQRVGLMSTEISVRRIPGAWETVQRGMREMITDFSGRWFLGPEVFEVPVAGKTGTAQNSRTDHAWFMGYGPLDSPDLAVVVFIENGGSSSAVAQPVARDFMASYWRHTGRISSNTSETRFAEDGKRD